MDPGTSASRRALPSSTLHQCLGSLLDGRVGELTQDESIQRVVSGRIGRHPTPSDSNPSKGDDVQTKLIDAGASDDFKDGRVPLDQPLFMLALLFSSAHPSRTLALTGAWLRRGTKSWIMA